MLFYIENLVGGVEVMKKWLQVYFTDFRTKSLDAQQMISHFEKYFRVVLGDKADKVFAEINWNEWLKNPALVNFYFYFFIYISRSLVLLRFAIDL